MFKDYKVLGFVVAMDEEAEPLLNKFNFVLIEKNPFLVYKYENIYIIISKIGTLNAALAAQYIILNYKCNAIINFGSAGFTGNFNHKGNIFSIDKIYKRDVDVTVLGYKMYQIPGEDEFISLTADPMFEAKTCYTSDEFVGPKSIVCENVLVEMEGYSIAFCCKKYNIDCFLYKSISDNTKENNGREQFDEYLNNAINNLGDYIIKIVSDFTK